MAYGVVVPAGLFSRYGLNQNYNELNPVLRAYILTDFFFDIRVA